MKRFYQLLFVVLAACCFVIAAGAQEMPSDVSSITSVAGVPLLTLNNGVQVPQLGLGTQIQRLEQDTSEAGRALLNETSRQAVAAALQAGYRHLDTAHGYFNERGVGQGIIDSGVPREEIWVTSKLWPSEFGEETTMAAIDAMLERLQLDYVDLVLLHHVPRNNDENGYHQMEQLVKEGKIRSLGLSNIYRDNATFDRMFAAAEIKPVLVQNENHPFFHWDDFQEYAAAQNVQIESWYPLGGRGFTQNYFNHPTLIAIAKKYSKTVPQILLRWQVQKGFICVPGSSNPDHIAENYDIFNFVLSDGDMNTIDAMQTGHGNFNMRA